MNFQSWKLLESLRNFLSCVKCKCNFNDLVYSSSVLAPCCVSPPFLVLIYKRFSLFQSKIKNGFKLIPEVGQSWQLCCMGLGTASSHFPWCVAPAPSRQHPASWSLMQPQQGAHRISCLEKIPVIFCNFLYYSLTRQFCLFQHIKDMPLILCFIKQSLGEGNIKI